MNPREAGFLLLTSRLGDPQRKPLTTAQFRILADRMQHADPPREDRELELRDLLGLGYSREGAMHLLHLLSGEAQLERYLHRGRQLGCVPVTRLGSPYPLVLRQRLGQDSPGCLWARGDLSLLNTPAVSLVGSRDLNPRNREFAREVGRQAAAHGITLISGNARGADQAAQNSALEAGGAVISVVADRLADKPLRDNLLYLSEEDFDQEFSTPRALSRNRVIHAMGSITFVAQCSMGTGGTWDGTTRNLRFGWSTVACFRDGSPASLELEQQGAWLIRREEAGDFLLDPRQPDSFF